VLIARAHCRHMLTRYQPGRQVMAQTLGRRYKGSAIAKWGSDKWEIETFRRPWEASSAAMYDRRCETLRVNCPVADIPKIRSPVSRTWERPTTSTQAETILSSNPASPCGATYLFGNLHAPRKQGRTAAEPGIQASAQARVVPIWHIGLSPEDL
jgi:hypothetical protein